MIINKDQKLNFIIDNNLGNIAQFISFSPSDISIPQYQCIKGLNKKLCTNDAIIALINSSKSKKINVRSFCSKKMKGYPLLFNKGVNDIEEVLDFIKKNANNNIYSIVNENIDINDGGVSGVILNNIIEFSPKDTPKCVDKPGVCCLPKSLGYEIFKIVYGFIPEINFPSNFRVEFSIHPSRQGIYNDHTIIWEYEEMESDYKDFKISWPNNFSRFIGDKVYGLLISYALGLRIPYTTVISRNIAPFSFGNHTSLNEKWIRTCPIEKEPGKYFTGNKWVDPFVLINNEEKLGEKDINIASVISQDSVESIYSGASIVSSESSNDVIEGVLGKGDLFMIGKESPNKLPDDLYQKLKSVNNKIRCHYNLLGDVSYEWVYDGVNIWVVQLNQIKENSNKNVIVQGNPIEYKVFNVSNGLDSLRELIQEIKHKNIGVILKGNIGITSHFGDLLRQSKISSYLLSES